MATKAELEAQLAILRRQAGAVNSAAKVELQNVPDGMYAKAVYEAPRGTKEPEKSKIIAAKMAAGTPDRYTIDLYVGGRIVETHMAKKWLTIIEAVTSGILTPQAIGTANAKIPVVAVPSKAVDNRVYGRRFL
jgi:hypothetical protein